VALSVYGSGSVGTYEWSGCSTTLRIIPSGSTPVSEHYPGVYAFPIARIGQRECQVTGGPRDAPGTIPAGSYELVVATYRPSDVVSISAPGATPDYGLTQCAKDLTVLGAWSSVEVRLTFKDPDCTITVSYA
jgi:hypothetical protein